MPRSRRRCRGQHVPPSLVMMRRISCAGKEIQGTVATSPGGVERFRCFMPLHCMAPYNARATGWPAARRLGVALLVALTLTMAAPAYRGETSPPNPLRGANIGFADIISGAERGNQQATGRGDQGDLSFLPELSA